MNNIRLKRRAVGIHLLSKLYLLLLTFKPAIASVVDTTAAADVSDTLDPQYRPQMSPRVVTLLSSSHIDEVQQWLSQFSTECPNTDVDKCYYLYDLPYTAHVSPVQYLPRSSLADSVPEPAFSLRRPTAGIDARTAHEHVSRHDSLLNTTCFEWHYGGARAW